MSRARRGAAQRGPRRRQAAGYPRTRRAAPSSRPQPTCSGSPLQARAAGRPMDRRSSRRGYAVSLYAVLPPLVRVLPVSGSAGARYECREPIRDRRRDSGAVPERVRAGDANDGAAWALRWHPERVALPLDDEGRDADGVELSEAALLRAAGRMEWEREAQDGVRIDLARRAAGDPRA